MIGFMGTASGAMARYQQIVEAQESGVLPEGTGDLASGLVEAIEVPEGLKEQLESLDYDLERTYVVGRCKRLVLAINNVCQKALAEGLDLSVQAGEGVKYADDVLEQLEPKTLATDPGRAMLRVAGQNLSDQLSRLNNHLIRRKRMNAIETLGQQAVAKFSSVDYIIDQVNWILKCARDKLKPANPDHMVSMGDINEIQKEAVDALKELMA